MRLFLCALFLSLFHLAVHLGSSLPLTWVGGIVSVASAFFISFCLLYAVRTFSIYYFPIRAMRVLLYGWVASAPLLGLVYYQTYGNMMETALISSLLLEPLFLARTALGQLTHTSHLVIGVLLVLIPGGLLAWILSGEKQGRFSFAPLFLFKKRSYQIVFVLIVLTQVRWAFKHDMAKLWIRCTYVLLVFALISVLLFLYRTQTKQNFLKTGLLVLAFVGVLVSPMSFLQKMGLTYEAHFYLAVTDSFFQSSASKKLAQDFSIRPSVQAFKFQPKYNVLYVVVDSWRAANSEIVGGVDAPLHEFYKHSLAFQQAYSPSNYTDTSIPSMFTGIGSDQPPQAMARAPRLWDYFHVNGYETGYFMTTDSQWAHLDIFLKSFGLDILWDAFSAQSGLVDPDNIDDASTVDYLMEKITSQKKPWFYVLHLDSPHYPYYQKAGHTPFQPCDLTHRENWPHSLLNCYKNSILYAAHLLQKLLSHVDLSKTIVILTSDHGEGFYEHGAYFHNQDLHTYAVHVPLVIHLPDSLKKSLPPAQIKNLEENQHQPVSLLDVVPTLLGLAQGWSVAERSNRPKDGTWREHWSGESLLAAHPSRMVFASGCYLGYRCFQREVAFITKDHYLIFSPKEKTSALMFQLYKASDKNQQKPLALSEAPEIFNGLLSQAQALHPFARTLDTEQMTR